MLLSARSLTKSVNNCWTMVGDRRRAVSSLSFFAILPLHLQDSRAPERGSFCAQRITPRVPPTNLLTLSRSHLGLTRAWLTNVSSAVHVALFTAQQLALVPTHRVGRFARQVPLLTYQSNTRPLIANRWHPERAIAIFLCTV